MGVRWVEVRNWVARSTWRHWKLKKIKFKYLKDANKIFYYQDLRTEQGRLGSWFHKVFHCWLEWCWSGWWRLQWSCWLQLLIHNCCCHLLETLLLLLLEILLSDLSTNQRSVLFDVNQSEISIVMFQPIKSQHCLMLTNQRSVYLCQPIRDDYYLSCLLHLLTLVSPPWYEEERPTSLTTCSGRRLGHTGCGISYIRLFCCHLKIWWS